jgi:5-methylcytosine-specific restriction endonuclease McrA
MPKTAKKPTRSKLIKKLDVVFSQYVRRSNADDRGFCTCVTCGKKGHWKTGGIQAGHFISRKHYSVRWDLDNVKPQCVACNVYRAGEQYKYSLYLGEKLSKKLYDKSLEITKFTSNEIEELIAHYQNLLKKYT